MNGPCTVRIAVQAAELMIKPAVYPAERPVKPEDRSPCGMHPQFTAKQLQEPVIVRLAQIFMPGLFRHTCKYGVNVHPVRSFSRHCYPTPFPETAGSVVFGPVGRTCVVAECDGCRFLQGPVTVKMLGKAGTAKLADSFLYLSKGKTAFGFSLHVRIAMDASHDATVSGQTCPEATYGNGYRIYAILNIPPAHMKRQGYGEYWMYREF